MFLVPRRRSSTFHYMSWDLVRPYAAATASVALPFLSGCSDDLDAAAFATAKCTNAIHGDLGLPESDTSLDIDEVFVQGSDVERTVTGQWTHPAKGGGLFTCSVVPDPTEKLRVLRVTRIDVQSTPAQLI